MASEYLMIGSPACGYCTNAKKLLESKEIEFTYANVNDINGADVAALEEVAGGPFRTVPQIFKYKKGGGLDYVGGYTELAQSFRND
jgi:glutaredoxin 3